MLEREITRLETELFEGSLEQHLTALEALLPPVRVAPDPVLLCRTLCMLIRVQVALGLHDAALAGSTEGLAAFDGLELVAALRYAGLHAEIYRGAGTAFLKLGRVADALPQLERAVAIAQAAIDATATPAAPLAGPPPILTPLDALIRSLVTMGIAMFAMREIDAAIQLYYRAIAAADAQPAVYQRSPDDIMNIFWNLTDALHERASRRRLAGDEALAQDDIAAARTILDPAHWKFTAGADDGGEAAFLRPLSASSRDGYYASMGRNLLLTGQPAKAREMFERQLRAIGCKPFVDDWGVADANAGMAQALIALDLPRAALDACALAVSALGRHDESNTRATVMLLRASALRSLGEFEATCAALEEHHRIRNRLEAVAAQQYAAHMTLQLGLERARADAESHRRIAATLETMSRVGQEITASLDAGAVMAILQRNVMTLLHASTFFVWLLDAAGDTLTLAFGIEDDEPVQAADLRLDDPSDAVALSARERREVSHAASPPMRVALFAPLIVGERVLGVITIQSAHADTYTENERSIFRSLCAYAAIGLDNAAAYHKLARTIDELTATQAELALRTVEFERLSMTDPLTGVANRRHLQERAKVEIAEVKRKNGRLAVAMFDIDYFKRVNDSYGHAVGDAVLQNVARVAKEWLRPADLIARVGGEEFALLLPGAGIREAGDIAERIRGSIAEMVVRSGDADVRVTSSFGVAEFDATIDVLDHALGCADTALYEAKLAGRNRVNCAR